MNIIWFIISTSWPTISQELSQALDLEGRVTFQLKKMEDTSQRDAHPTGDESSIPYHESQIKTYLELLTKDVEEAIDRAVESFSSSLRVAIHLLAIFNMKREKDPKYAEKKFVNYV